MDVHQIKYDLEFSKDYLLETILKNRGNLEVDKVVEAIKEFVRNQDRYDSEKKKMLYIISNLK
ncbi:MAG: hypothetical protein OEM18_07855 [Nitrosopumilus sp.]|nr:hypothetical protein [Nitrosopumilus sp.]MDH3502485.1 hypothetical protein [Nitrosopumilus sp.]